MDTNFALLACCLLALSFATSTPPTEKGNYISAISSTGTITVTPSSNLTNTTATVTLSDTTTGGTTLSALVTSTLTEGATGTPDNSTLSAASTNNPQTPQSTTTWTSTADTAPNTKTPTPPVLTTQADQTTVGNTSTPDTSFHSTAITVNASDSMCKVTQGLGLNSSEKIMTILFSVALGVAALGLVVYVFHRCKQRIQYLHQPLDNTEDTDRFVADNDTLVISGGLYDGHPIYDNQPTATTEEQNDRSQFRLEFLHEGERIPTF